MTKTRLKRTGIAIALALAAIVVAVPFLGVSLGSLRDVTSGELIVPLDSPVQVSYGTTEFGGSAHVFFGDLVISGTYYYGPEVAGSSPVAFIVPDSGSAAVLPYWKRWGPPKRIDLSNPEVFAKAALPQSVLDSIARRRSRLASGHITLVASEYEATGECDQPIYLAKFKSVSKPNDMLASKENTVTNCG